MKEMERTLAKDDSDDDFEFVSMINGSLNRLLEKDDPSKSITLREIRRKSEEVSRNLEMGSSIQDQNLAEHLRECNVFEAYLSMTGGNPRDAWKYMGVGSNNHASIGQKTLAPTLQNNEVEHCRPGPSGTQTFHAQAKDDSDADDEEDLASTTQGRRGTYHEDSDVDDEIVVREKAPHYWRLEDNESLIPDDEMVSEDSVAEIIDAMDSMEVSDI